MRYFNTAHSFKNARQNIFRWDTYDLESFFFL